MILNVASISAQVHGNAVRSGSLGYAGAGNRVGIVDNASGLAEGSEAVAPPDSEVLRDVVSREAG